MRAGAEGEVTVARPLEVWVRPWWRGTASTSTLPPVSDRTKCVVLVSPTASCPRPATAALAPTLAALSTAVA